MSQDEEFNAPAIARELLLISPSGTLATLKEDGSPFASLIEVAPDTDGQPVTLISTLAVHTQNALRDPRASILLDRRESAGPILTKARISLTGKLVQLDDGPASSRFLAHFPDAQMYAGFADFAYWKLEIEACHLVAGFGRIVAVAREDLILEPVPALAEAESDIIAHMNADHAETMALYARKLGHEAESSWQCAGVDTLGMTLRSGAKRIRVPFPKPVNSPQVLRMVLKELADAARSASG